MGDVVVIQRNGIPGPGSEVLQPLVDEAEGFRDESQLWAEGTEPGGPGTFSAKTQANRAALSVPFLLRSDLLAAPGAIDGVGAIVTADTSTHVAVSGEVALGGVPAVVGAAIPNTGRYTRISGAWLRTGDTEEQLSAAQAGLAIAAAAVAPVYTQQQQGRLENANTYTPLSPGPAWDGTAGTGFTTVPVSQTRVNGQAMIRLITPPFQAFTNSMVVGVEALANNAGGLENFGLEKVSFYLEGNKVDVLKPSFQTMIDANGVSRTYYGWWVTLVHNGITGNANNARLYAEGIPKDPAIASRVIGPYLYNLKQTLYDYDLTVEPSQPVISGSRYQTVTSAVNYIRTNGGAAAKNARIRIMESGTYTYAFMSGMSGVWSSSNGWIEITHGPGVTVNIANPDGTGDRIDTKTGALRFRGAGLIFDMKNISRIDNDTSGGRGAWFDGVRFINSGGLGALWFNRIRDNAYVANGQNYVTECYLGNQYYSLYGSIIARGNTVFEGYGDVATGTLLLKDNSINTNNTPYRTEEAAFTVQYTGTGATATLSISNKPGSGSTRTFTVKVDGLTVGTWVAAINGSVNYTMTDLVAWLNTLSDVTATLNSAKWSAQYAGAPGNGDASTPATDIKTAPVTFTARSYLHADIYQGTSSSSNLIMSGNIGYNLIDQFLWNSSGGAADYKDIAMYNNCWHQTSSYYYRIQIAITHLVFVNNSMNYSLYVDNALNQYSLVAGNVVLSFEGSATVSSAYKNNHVMNAGGKQTGQVGYSQGGNAADLFASVVTGDFTPAGLLLTNLKSVTGRYDKDGLRRQSPTTAGAIS